MLVAKILLPVYCAERKPFRGCGSCDLKTLICLFERSFIATLSSTSGLSLARDYLFVSDLNNGRRFYWCLLWFVHFTGIKSSSLIYVDLLCWIATHLWMSNVDVCTGGLHVRMSSQWSIAGYRSSLCITPHTVFYVYIGVYCMLMWMFCFMSECLAEKERGNDVIAKLHDDTTASSGISFWCSFYILK